MAKLSSGNLRMFVELLKEEHTISNNLIPTIYDILIEATGFIEPEVNEQKKTTKKEIDKQRSKNRLAKESLQSFQNLD
jgi:hypothetical protein